MNGTFSDFFVWPKWLHLSSWATLLLTATWLDTFKWLKSKVPDSPGENGTFSNFFVWANSHHLSSWATLLLTVSRLDVSKMSYEFLATDGRTHTVWWKKNENFNLAYLSPLSTDFQVRVLKILGRTKATRWYVSHSKSHLITFKQYTSSKIRVIWHV